MSRVQAQEYLCLSETAVDDMCVPLAANPRPVTGKIRVRPLKLAGSKRIMPRLVKADVYRILPRPDGVEALEITQ